MRPISMNLKPYGAAAGRAAIALALAAIIGGLTALPARADDDDRGDRGRGYESRDNDHRRDDRGRWREREWHRDHPDVYAAPGYAYAPPPVVYAPMLVPPALNFVFPLRFR
jgi:hypothetical protein